MNKWLWYALGIVCVLAFFISRPVFADELEDIAKKITEIQQLLEESKKASKPLEDNLQQVENDIRSIENSIYGIEQGIVDKEKEIALEEKELDSRRAVLDVRVRQYYKHSRSYVGNSIGVFLGNNLPNALRKFFIQQKSIQTDRDGILKVAFLIVNLQEKKLTLEDEKTKLTALKTSLDKEKGYFEAEVAKAQGYQSSLTKEIAELTAKQQQIINARSGGFTVNIGDSELADDYNASIKGFRESAPGGYFAAFSFGAYTHRKGMSQYGALARASSQDYKQILSAYYGKEPVSMGTDGTIKVSGYGELDFETVYLYGIAEMPSSWPMEALKAQAVAARTYAYRYKTEGTEICIDEGCQVFRKDKSDNPPQAWKDAVDQTRGQVLEGVVTFYSSTAGGYLTTKGWDTTDGGGGSNFLDKSYEKLAGSPWVYKSWYTESYNINSDKCGRENPWLNPEEMADIINAAFVIHRSGSGADAGRVTPISSCWGGNPYSMDELRSVSGSYGGGVSSATGVVVSLGEGTTNEVVFQTDQGERRLSGAEFKKGFNLRAPGRLSIPQNGFAFFNIEKK